jgi:cytochrome c oxidase assembly factor CtaG
MIFSIFEDQLTWNITLLFLLIFVIIVYLILCKKFAIGYDCKVQPYLFIGSLCILYLMKGSPLSVISHFSFSTHMLQMSLLSFFIPPFLLLGVPQSLFQTGFLKKKKTNNNRRVNLIIIPSLFLFGIGLLLYHFPYTALFIMVNPGMHELYLWILFFLAIMMWIPLTTPEYSKYISWKSKYTMLKTLVITPACLILIFLPFAPGINPLFSNMSTLCVPQEYINQLLPFPFNTKYDQQFGGLLMFLLHKLSVFLTFKMEKIFRKDPLNAQS